ncbi:serine hydrolase domain-containing protein [Streptomyces sp. NPDC051940]|uniref:serine hydrolase domain-containing protein n=1 Tax=Streptomyces sp. NPDC051940 TaxID=3155675 RepID=UPI00343A7E34
MPSLELSALVGPLSADHGVPTVVAAVDRGDGRAPLVYGAGVPDGVNALDAVFDLASVTKVAATTALLMGLVARGRVDLDGRIGRVLPGPHGGVTVRELLEHRAGLALWWPLYVAGAREPGAALDLVRTLPAAFARGSGRHYSDLGFMLLGALAQEAGGAPLAELAAERVFRPLGMAAAGYLPPPGRALVASARGDAVERLMVATGSPYPVPFSPGDFAGWREGLLVGECDDGNAWHAFGGVAGHAGLFGSAADLLAYGRALLASLDGRGPWPAAVAAEFAAPGADPGQALGFRRWPRYGAVGHPGFTGTRFAVVPAVGATVVLLTNRLLAPGDPPVDAVWDALLSAVVGGRA